MNQLVNERHFGLLADAFLQDPMCKYLYNSMDVNKEYDAVKKVFSFMYKLGKAYGHLITTKNEEGIIVYTKSYVVCKSLTNQLKIGAIPLLFNIGIKNFIRSLRYDAYSQKMHTKHAKKDDIYLYIIAVNPSHHRKGFGSTLICDLQQTLKPNQRIYLETSNPNNIPFYEKFGFKILEDFVVPKSDVHIWPMVYVKG